MRVLCCLWSLGFEETESDPVCVCSAKIIPLGNARVGNVDSHFNKTHKSVSKRSSQLETKDNLPGFVAKTGWK